MKVLVEIFDGNTVRGMLVSKDELEKYAPKAKNISRTKNSRLPNAPKVDRSQFSKAQIRRLPSQ